MGEQIRNVLILQLEAHFANFLYVLAGIGVFILMYFMADCMYTKEIGMIILGWLGVLIRAEGRSVTQQRNGTPEPIQPK